LIVDTLQLGAIWFIRFYWNSFVVRYFSAYWEYSLQLVIPSLTACSSTVAIFPDEELKYFISLVPILRIAGG